MTGSRMRTIYRSQSDGGAGADHAAEMLEAEKDVLAMMGKDPALLERAQRRLTVMDRGKVFFYLYIAILFVGTYFVADYLAWFTGNSSLIDFISVGWNESRGH